MMLLPNNMCFISKMIIFNMFAYNMEDWTMYTMREIENTALIIATHKGILIPLLQKNWQICNLLIMNNNIYM